MARKYDKTGRTRHASRFVMLEHYLLSSMAWRSLSPPARAAYIEIAQRYVPGNNGKICVSGRTLADGMTVSRQTAIRCLAELSERGFIDCVRGGAFNIKSGDRRAAEWRLTSYKCDVTGAPPSRNFMRWQDGKIHLPASPEGHTGLTRGPQTSNAQ